MGVSIYVYFPANEAGAGREELEDDLEETFFGDAAEFVGSGSGTSGSNLDFELADDEDADVWTTRLRDYLRDRGVRPSTFFEVFPDGWEPGQEWRRVEVFGRDRWLTKPDA